MLQIPKTLKPPKQVRVQNATNSVNRTEMYQTPRRTRPSRRCVQTWTRSPQESWREERSACSYFVRLFVFWYLQHLFFAFVCWCVCLLQFLFIFLNVFVRAFLEFTSFMCSEHVLSFLAYFASAFLFSCLLDICTCQPPYHSYSQRFSLTQPEGITKIQNIWKRKRVFCFLVFTRIVWMN